MSEAGAAGEAGAEEYDDDVFVPHYGNYVHAATPTRNGHQPQQGSCLANKYGIRADLLQVASAARRNSAAEEVSITQGLFSTRTFSPPPSVLRQIGAQHQPWKSGACGDSSSLSSIDNKLGLVGLHQKLSELQVALQASERAREEGQQETNALRVYLGNVEAAAASLVTRIQELQHLLALSSAVQQGQDVDQLRGKVATEATKEARNHAASAAQAISAAREATMELDKVKRDSYALTTAQAAEIERLCAETADYHTICEVLHLDQISKTLEHGHSNLKTSIRC
jgi:hypothetical protein